MVQAARSQLGLLAERYAAPALAGDRQSLAAADIDLGAALAAVRGGEVGPARQRLIAWLADSEGWGRVLTVDEPRSLYSAKALAQAAR
jgi:hypothetical protein